MCRSIRTLHNFEPPATDEEVHAAALQYVRKIMGASRPSGANRAVFERTVEQVTAETRILVDALVKRLHSRTAMWKPPRLEPGPLAAGRAPHEES